MMKEGCVFCRIAAGEIGQPIWQDDALVAFHDLSPRAPTHLLIIPRIHLDSADDLTPEHERLAGRLLTTAARLAREAGLVNGGYRLVMNTGAGAGQSVFHLHLHLLAGRPFAWPPG